MPHIENIVKVAFSLFTKAQSLFTNYSTQYVGRKHVKQTDYISIEPNKAHTQQTTETHERKLL